MNQTQDSLKKNRKVGFEIEYTGIETLEAAELIQQLYGGKLHHITEVDIEVNETGLGDFNVIIDARLLKKLAENKSRLLNSIKPGKLLNTIFLRIIHLVSRGVKTTAEIVVPYEIITPPVAEADIAALDKLCDSLRDRGVAGTSSQPYYAFGLHINPEAHAFDPGSITRHIQSFLLLEPWLAKKHNADITRRIAPMIEFFPAAYKSLVLDVNYLPDLERLVRDYHQFNKTRNRALDMLPLFAYLDGALIDALYGKNIKNNPRPTYHYRLANSDISRPEWSIRKEFEIWLHVERLAKNVNILHEAINAWQVHQHRWFRSKKAWRKTIDQIVEAEL